LEQKQKLLEMQRPSFGIPKGDLHNFKQKLKKFKRACPAFFLRLSFYNLFDMSKFLFITEVFFMSL
jgi:hypothetical protein